MTNFKTDATPEELKELAEQLRTARQLLKEAGAAIPNRSFFDPTRSAFEEKIKTLLYVSLEEHKIDKDKATKICDEFITAFNTNILAMTPFGPLSKKGKK